MRRLSPFPLLLPLAACATPISGQYDLRSINGEPLRWEEIGYTGAEGRVLRIRELTAATLELNDDGTCRYVSSSSDRDIPGADPELRRPPSTDVDHCTWSASGRILTLEGPEGRPDEQVVGSVADGVVTLTFSVFGEEFVVVYELAKR